ncbi:hypothetical protein NA56DRAFT_586567, partial [Hyaloscypha hepaticicola]
SNIREFPRIVIIVYDYLPIPGTEIDMERLFNITRDILDFRRGVIKGEILRALILIKDHLHREKIGQI